MYTGIKKRTKSQIRNIAALKGTDSGAAKPVEKNLLSTLTVQRLRFLVLDCVH